RSRWRTRNSGLGTRHWRSPIIAPTSKPPGGPPMARTFENIEIDRVGTDGRLGRITLNRPEKMNSLSQELLFELNDALHDLEADDSCRVIIIRGAGRTFSAGYDLTPARGGADGVVRRYNAVDDSGRRLMMGIRTGTQQPPDHPEAYWHMREGPVAP